MTIMRKELKTFEVERVFFLELLCLASIRHLTAATAAGTLARLFTEWLCYVLCRFHSSYVLSTRVGLHRIELINRTLVNDDFSDLKKKSIYLC